MTGELILLVDDEPNIIELAQLYLEREGYRTITASNGKAALNAVEKERPALMVLDVMMPEVDGLEVCRTLRGKKDPVAILMLTARDEDIDKILGLELGADDYLTKPFNPRELVSRVKAVLRRSSTLSEVTIEKQISRFSRFSLLCNIFSFLSSPAVKLVIKSFFNVKFFTVEVV